MRIRRAGCHVISLSSNQCRIIRIFILFAVAAFGAADKTVTVASLKIE